MTAMVTYTNNDGPVMVQLVLSLNDDSVGPIYELGDTGFVNDSSYAKLKINCPGVLLSAGDVIKPSYTVGGPFAVAINDFKAIFIRLG